VCLCVCVSLIMCMSYKPMVSIVLVALRQNKVHPQQAPLCLCEGLGCDRSLCCWLC